MKKLNVFALIGIFCICSFTASAQNDTEAPKEKRFKHGLGIAAGLTTGYGLSYRYMFSKFTIQGTFAPLVDGDRQQYSTGITFIYNLVENRNTNLFLYQGNHFYYEKDKYYNYYGYNYAEEVYREESNLNQGLGIGIEFIILKNVSFNLMGGYASYDSFSRIGFTGETGLFYRF